MEKESVVEEKVCNTDITQEFRYDSYVKWKTEALYRSICSSRELENYDIQLAYSSIRLMKKMYMKVCWMWNSAGGFLAFNPKDFHVMITEHYWASCYKNLHKARENFEESLRQKCETIYVCPNIFNIQDTSEKVLTCLSTSLEYLKELEALLLLHNQKPENENVIERSPILGIDKDKPVYWTECHEIVYFQICNCYMANIIKELLQRMDNLFLVLRAIDSIDFWRELSENEKCKSTERKMPNEVMKIVSKPKRLRVCKPGLQTISEELPVMLAQASISKLFRRLKSHSSFYSSDAEDIGIENSEKPMNYPDTSAMMSMEPLIYERKNSSEIHTEKNVEKPEGSSLKKQKFPVVISNVYNKTKLFNFGRKPIAFIMQKIRKNSKSFDSLSMAKLTSGTKGLI